MKSFKLSLIHIILITVLLFIPNSNIACTIVSAIAENGHVWNANNEDGPFGVANFINIYPKSDDQKFGYYTLSYLSPKYGNSGQIQGGMNEMGLTFDFNAIPTVEDFDPDTKKAFHKGDDAILPFILGTMKSVEEVINFFGTYWFQNGFKGAQMHVADRQGRFAIISASGIKLVEKGKFLVSTNFDICKNENNSTCWRYPIATSKLNTEGASLDTMIAICKETAQKNGATMYSNIQNLTTGDIWLFSKHDPDTIINININDLLAKKNQSFTFSDLGAILKDKRKNPWTTPRQITLEDTALNNYIGTYYNAFIGEVIVQENKNGIEVSFADGVKITMHPSSSDDFFFSSEKIILKFKFDVEQKKMSIRFFENGCWSFTAWRNPT